MLLVSQEQRRNAGNDAFVSRIVRHMKLHYWKDIGHLPEDVLRGRVAHCIQQGRALNLTFERSLAVFTANMMRIDPCFHQQKAIAELLATEAMPEAERLDGLISMISRQQWAEAGKMCADRKEYWDQVDRGMSDPRGEE